MCSNYGWRFMAQASPAYFREICTVYGAKMKSARFRCFTLVGLRTWIIIVLIAAYSVVPFALKYSLRLQSMMIYVNFIPSPLMGDLSNPEYFGLEGTRHMCLKQYDKLNVCLWHILPAQCKNVSAERYSDVFGGGAPVIVYAHGNTGSRAVYHRVQLYQQLSALGYHVVAFDYRGFGDSGGSPSEVGLLEDLELVWNWLLPQVGDAQVFVYGHSLGTAPASKLAAQLAYSSSSPSGVILDAPYTTIKDAAFYHPFGIPYWPFMSTFFKPVFIDHIEEEFPVVKYVQNITCPLLIFHGKRDLIVPFHLGVQVYYSAVHSAKDSNRVFFHDCGDSTHKKNYLSQNFSSALNRFVEYTRELKSGLA